MLHFRLSKNQVAAAMILALAVFSGALIIQANAQSSSRNSSFSFKKDSNNLFTVTVRDPQGIKEFSLQPPGKFSYGGSISGCPTSRKIDNVVFDDPTDFTPAMAGYVVDCGDNKDEFGIPPPKNGVTSGARVGVEPEKETAKPAAPSPAGEPETTKSSVSPSSGGAAGSSASKSDVKYPVAGLGNCSSEFECRVYCDAPANISRCLDYAEKHNLIKSDEIERGRKFKQVLDRGGTPGGCDSQQACEVYCNDTDNLDKCLAFGEQNGFLSGKELEEAKKVHEAIKSGRQLPGGCKNKTACEAYCKNPGHMEECIAFAKESGFMSKEELEEAEKFLPLIKSGKMPGGCKSKEECEVYCESDEHMDECIDFAVKHDLIPKEDRDRVEAFRKAGGKGPGGCRGRQCQAFCEKQENQKACFVWAKENGMLREEDLKRMEEGKQQLKQALEQMPPEARECVDAVIGPGGVEGDFFGGPEIGDKIKGCFEQAFGGSFGGPGGPGGPGFGGDFSGPGGCKSREECEAFCQDNQEECQDFHPPGGGQGGGPVGGGGFGGGPGGCKSIDECTAYCQEHLDECQGFGPPGGGAGRGGPPGGGFPGGSGGEFPGGPPGGGFPGGPPGGGFPGGGGGSRGGPGGCQSQEECQAYCTEHPKECGGGGSPEGDHREGGEFGPSSGFPDEGRSRGGSGGATFDVERQKIESSLRQEELKRRLGENPVDKLRGSQGGFPIRNLRQPLGAPVGNAPESDSFNQEFQKQFEDQRRLEVEHQVQEQIQKQSEGFRLEGINSPNVPSSDGDFRNAPSSFPAQPSGDFNSGNFAPPPAGDFHNAPPSGSFPSGSFPPPGSFPSPESFQSSPPPSGDFQLPPPPSGAAPKQNFLGRLLNLILK